MNIKILIPYFSILITSYTSYSKNYKNKKGISNSTQIYNSTYYLYLIDTVNNQVHKVKNFEKTLYPSFDSNDHLIINYVLSGRNCTSLYETRNDRIYNYGLLIYNEGSSENNILNSYNNEYKKPSIKFNRIKSNNTYFL